MMFGMPHFAPGCRLSDVADEQAGSDADMSAALARFSVFSHLFKVS